MPLDSEGEAVSVTPSQSRISSRYHFDTGTDDSYHLVTLWP